MKSLLIQVRPDRVVADHEYKCYLAQSGLSETELDRLNVFDRVPNVGDLAGYDVLLIGGSGDVSLSDGNEPEKVQVIIELIKAARTKGMPIFGACFGGQLMAVAFGGRVEVDKAREEVGTLEMTRATTAQGCPIFADLPDKFDVQIGHKDHIEELPPGAINLISSEKSPMQVFTFPGEPVYGIVFHPELDETALKYRVDYYSEEYGWSQEFRNALYEDVKPTPYADKILRLFYEKVVHGGARYQKRKPQMMEKALT